jgi:hypothetical protein
MDRSIWHASRSADPTQGRHSTSQTFRGRPRAGVGCLQNDGARPGDVSRDGRRSCGRLVCRARTTRAGGTGSGCLRWARDDVLQRRSRAGAGTRRAARRPGAGASGAGGRRAAVEAAADRGGLAHGQGHDAAGVVQQTGLASPRPPTSSLRAAATAGPRTPLLAIPRVNTEVRLVRCGTCQRRFESADGGDAALAGVEQLVPVLGRPSARGGQRLQHAAAQRCQRVLHPQFRVGVHRA